MLPLVALVGRPNVGKSTLFNALTRTRDALVHDQPGVTRDRNYGVCRLQPETPFVLVDTGGIAGDEEGLAGATARQSRAAAAEADLVLFIVDAREGASALDDEILAWLRKTARPTLLVLNKIDGVDEEAARADFARYGFADVLTLSAAHRQGVDELVEEVLERVPAEGAGELLDEDPQRMRIAFVGRPNVGKSTLVNRLLGEERMIASEVPGTTRDSIAVDLEREGRLYRLVDTAGLRRKGRVDEVVEKFSIVKTLQAIEQCQVAVLLLDASEGVTDQDASVLGAILDAGRALVVAVNKWDGLTDYQRQQAEQLLSRKLGFVEWAEAVRISAKHGSGLRELFRAIHRAHASATKTFSTSEVNTALEIAYESNPPPSIRGHVSKLRYVHPGGENPPTFIVHGTRLKVLPESYKRYLENFFRKRFKLVGTPVRFLFREGANPYEGKKNVLTERQIAKKKRLIRHVKRGK
ncbi:MULTISPECIES: ribosome biogenesis GTPase Der [Pseudoxanthomonas]|jgi:GTP-binding protein|uniref:GTPase Der n=1 Tax=Pseudoxanthomonas winnipegensis TaxID=2480810 RepID=A0A4V2HE31_9GAMM|nr:MULTISPECIES: ribosome biogenesis GTPase Der [Pseudoxanthomonas]MDQ1119176.1 GTP-binding protein [Pseudoxanthomonas winnipegensis]MDQ1132367.1 GTP-binding protein [Pseudoxanthomonas winnipegensis]MDR6137622.1 GTP-binding protein [Pseudoxanthomonas sp. SORGH_AS_0997]RZZ87916.1 ribosome biogenesis GTPase Der [Pseudoxanthomonas winnipegensis]TAA08763.1 ribosome biogenesis GTPase Der [Pseudoxanthomonas winnipegensis]